MELKITRENFLTGLSKTQGVVEKKNTMPVLSNVLLEADKNGLKIFLISLVGIFSSGRSTRVFKTSVSLALGMRRLPLSGGSGEGLSVLVIVIFIGYGLIESLVRNGIFGLKDKRNQVSSTHNANQFSVFNNRHSPKMIF